MESKAVYQLQEEKGETGGNLIRCTCNKLLCVINGNNIEIKCNKCKRTMVIKSKGIINVEIT